MGYPQSTFGGKGQGGQEVQEKKENGDGEVYLDARENKVSMDNGSGRKARDISEKK